MRFCWWLRIPKSRQISSHTLSVALTQPDPASSLSRGTNSRLVHRIPLRLESVSRYPVIQGRTYANLLHQSTAASTWWCGPRPRLGWVEMAVGLPEGPSYPGHSPLFFSLCCPLTTAEGQHTASLKSVACSLFFSFISPAPLVPIFVSSFSWWAVTFIPTLAPSSPALCALEMWPGGASQCNAAPAPNGSI